MSIHPHHSRYAVTKTLSSRRVTGSTDADVASDSIIHPLSSHFAIFAADVLWAPLTQYYANRIRDNNYLKILGKNTVYNIQ